MQQRALARARLAHNGQHFALKNIQSQMLKKNQPAPAGQVFLAQPPGADNDWMMIPRGRTQRRRKRVVRSELGGGNRIHTSSTTPFLKKEDGSYSFGR